MLARISEIRVDARIIVSTFYIYIYPFEISEIVLLEKAGTAVSRDRSGVNFTRFRREI